MTMTVLCVLRTGGVYDVRYVRALSAGLQECSPGTRLTCLTDVPDKVAPYVDEALLLNHQWPKWWCLVEWFRPDLVVGPVIAVGLDTLILGPLDDLGGFRGKLAMISDFYMPQVLASGVMLWQNDACESLYHQFMREGPAKVIGSHPRMDFWLRKATAQCGLLAPDSPRVQDLYPGQVFSYKAHARNGPPAGARVVCGHGRPQFSEPTAGWAHHLWRRRTLEGGERG